MEQAIEMVSKMVADGVDSTVACCRAADALGLSVQAVINEWMWA